MDDLTAYRRRQAISLAKRKTELTTTQDRLLNAYLAGMVEEVIYKAEAVRAEEALAQLGDVDPARSKTALAPIDWTQNAAEIWRGPNNSVRRDLLSADLLQLHLGYDHFVRRCCVDKYLFLKLDTYIGPGGGLTKSHSTAAFNTIRVGTSPDFISLHYGLQ